MVCYVLNISWFLVHCPWINLSKLPKAQKSKTEAVASVKIPSTRGKGINKKHDCIRSIETPSLSYTINSLVTPWRSLKQILRVTHTSCDIEKSLKYEQKRGRAVSSRFGLNYSSGSTTLIHWVCAKTLQFTVSSRPIWIEKIMWNLSQIKVKWKGN